MSDNTEIGYTHQMLYHHRHHHLTSRKARVEHLYLLQKTCPPKNDPPGRLDGKLKNHKLVHIPPTKNDKTPTQKCRVCVRKNIKKETRFFCAQCGVPLQPEDCYTQYHTLKHC